MNSTEIARALASLRKSFRPKVLRACPKCGSVLGAREMRVHKPGCKISTKIIVDT